MTTQTTATTHPLPADLEQAVEQAEELLVERGNALAVLSKSHSEIPRLLDARLQLQGELGEVETRGEDSTSRRKRLSEIETALNTQRRMRSACIEQLVRQESDLDVSRARVESTRAGYGQQAIAELRRRYDAKVEGLQALWSEGDALAAALGVPVDLPLPVRVTGGPQPSMHPWPAEPLPVKVERVLGDAALVTIDGNAARIGRVVDGLNKALAHCGGIRSTLLREGRLGTLTTGRAFDPQGIFRVAKPFVNHLDSMQHQPGELVDSSLLGVVTLQRLAATKAVMLVTAGPAGAAA